MNSTNETKNNHKMTNINDNNNKKINTKTLQFNKYCKGLPVKAVDVHLSSVNPK